jgi:long-subunit acyl-CoA synthetase (AMP-forming)
VPELLAQLDAALQAGWEPPSSLEFVAVGGARVAPAMLARCRAAGLPVFEGYGLSECASVVSLNCPQADREGSCGRVLPHVQVSEIDGELVVAGNSFLGYLDQPDSWGQQAIHTGDIGSVDSDGYVTVLGRRRNRLITSFGRNVNPEWVESELLGSGVLRQAWVLGEGRPSCAALLCPLDDTLPDSELQVAVQRVNGRLPDYARIGSWLRLDAALTPASGLLTANGRPRRDAIARHFAAQINQLYSNDKEQFAS